MTFSLTRIAIRPLTTNIETLLELAMRQTPKSMRELPYAKQVELLSTLLDELSALNRRIQSDQNLPYAFTEQYIEERNKIFNTLLPLQDLVERYGLLDERT